MSTALGHPTRSVTGLQECSSFEKPGSSFWGSRLISRVRMVQNFPDKICGLCRAVAQLDYAETSSLSQGHRTVNGNISAVGSTITSTDRVTGSAYDFYGATEPLAIKPLLVAKKIVLVRHGLSSWNEEGRVQGSSDLSVLSAKGLAQAKRCREALSNMKFDQCFASPISRAKTSAEVIWSGRDEPLVFLDTLREANLNVLEGMLNVDARKQYPELFRTWREDPSNFSVNGVYPIVELWAKAKLAWQDLLSSPGELVLVVTHKSILRALLCTALGMGPDRFRAVDINNGGVCAFSVNKRGEPMLDALNMTAHLHADGVFY